MISSTARLPARRSARSDVDAVVAGGLIKLLTRQSRVQFRRWYLNAGIQRLKFYGTLCGEAEALSPRGAVNRLVDRHAATVWYGTNKSETGRHKPILAANSRRKPMADKSNDPVAMWQNMIGEMGEGIQFLR